MRFLYMRYQTKAGTFKVTKIIKMLHKVFKNDLYNILEKLKIRQSLHFAKYIKLNTLISDFYENFNFRSRYVQI